MELVPHITLNPSFNIDMLEYIEASEVSPTTELARRDPLDDPTNDTANLVDDNSEKSLPNG